MKKITVIILLFFTSTLVYALEYFPAEIKKDAPPTIQLQTPFDQQRLDVSITARKPLTGYDSLNRKVAIPGGTQMLMESTLSQIYNGFQKASPFTSMFTKDGRSDIFNVESPDALRIKAMFNELLDIKMQEQMFDRLGVSGRSRDELVDVRIKKEGEIKETTVKIKKKELEEAAQEKDTEITVESIPYRLPTDYNGEETWTVERRTEASDIFKIKCVVCGPKKDDLKTQLSVQTLNGAISSKYESYSKSSKVETLIKSAMSNKRNPVEYKKNVDVRSCYAYVKEALLKAKLVDDRPEGVSPRYAGEQLKYRGFTNIMEDPEFAGKITDPTQAPKGAVLVYEPSPANLLVRVKDKKTQRWMIVPDYGHIEIKTEEAGKSGYVSDYYSTSARTGKSLEAADRKLIGIYIKPETK